MASVSIVSDEQLDPGRRALLDLTLRHGMSDEQLASIVGGEVDEIARRRDEAFDAIIAQARLSATDRNDPIAVADRILAESRAAREEAAERAAPAKPKTGKLDLFL